MSNPQWISKGSGATAKCAARLYIHTLICTSYIQLYVHDIIIMMLQDVRTPTLHAPGYI
jgi:hypothetical protein